MTKSKEPKSNTEFVHDLMEFSRYGALVQLFVLQALLEYSRLVAKADPVEMQAQSNGLVSGAAWVGVAKEVVERVERHLGPLAEPVEEGTLAPAAAA